MLRPLVLLGGLEGGEASAPLAPALLDADSGHWHCPRVNGLSTYRLSFRIIPLNFKLKR